MFPGRDDTAFVLPAIVRGAVVGGISRRTGGKNIFTKKYKKSPLFSLPVHIGFDIMKQKISSRRMPV